jgi:hypothetical protein
MIRLNRLTVAVSLGALALTAAACTPADNDADTAANETAATDTNTTTVIEREVPADPVVVEREVPVPAPVVVEDRRDGDSTTIRANGDGLEVETTNR